MRTGVPMTGARVIGPGNPPPVLNGQRLGRNFNRTREQADSSWPAFHAMLERVEVLERAPVFFTLPESTIRNLARRVRQIMIAAGGAIVYQGEPGDTIFFIEAGRCRVIVERPPNAVTVAVLGPGDFFGETACMLGHDQQASVIAETDCRLVALDKQSMTSVIGRDTAFLDELRRLANQRYRTFADTAVQAAWGMLLGEATVVGLYSPKGGSGGTCLALNLVGCLSRSNPGQVVLLDLDFPYSHAALLAGLVPTSCLARMAATPPEAFEESDDVTPDLIARAVTVLRKTFRYVVVDMGIAIDDSTLAVLDLTQHVIVITAPELSAVKSAADAIDILRKLGTPDDRLTVVLNNRSAKPAVMKTAVERTLKRSIDVEVAFDGAKPDEAALTGTILSLTDHRSEITRGARTLADILEGKHGNSRRRLQQINGGAPAAVESDC